ncbi:DUF2142 domain-containing protein [Enterobacter quasiroggenkampii]|uniref:DUF2142 domain-containing protein n=1 Tax=Enterobacter TaxID=547 RepID=UPI002DBE1DAE|nr:DUF2142 domain-containing protein [Enterobacter quasiroggenkampii]MEB6578249.1 DUF2142 domain-containing protein [Enterobacter quasiroggenkampii]
MGIKSQRIVFIFLVIVVIAFSLLKKPFGNPDEGAHFLRAYEVSHFHLINRAGDIGVGINCQDYFSAAKKHFLIAWYQPESESLDANCMVKSINSAGTYPPLPYLPLAISLSVSKFMHLSVEHSVYFMRIVNGFSCLFLIYFFSSRLLLGQHSVSVLLILAMLPMALSLWASVSADALTLALCLCFIFYILSFDYSRTSLIKRKEWILLYLLAFAIGNSKVGYSMITITPLVLHFCCNGFMVFKRSLIRSTLLFIGCVLLAVGTSIVWVKFTDKSLVYLGNGAVPLEQMCFVLKNPLYFISLSVSVVFDVKHLYSTILPLHYGLNGMYMLIAFWLLLVNLFFACVTNPHFNLPNKFSCVSRTGCFAFFLILFFVFGVVLSLPLYLTYNPVAYDDLLGFQGRYLLPILPILVVSLLVISISNLINNHFKQILSLTTFVIPAVINIAIIIRMITR